MTNQEFSNEFDILYNNVMSNQAPGLNEYEKSVFLTTAQDDVLKSYFDPKLNKVQEGYDGSERRQIDFSMVTVIKKITSFGSPLFDGRSNSKSVVMPNALFMLNEKITVYRDGKPVELVVIPISFTDYNKHMTKPYMRPLKRQAWRLISNDSNNHNIKSNTADIIVGPNDRISQYSCRYIRRPYPIILENTDNLTIDGQIGPKSCELDPIIHHDILKRAVELAKAAYTGDLSSTIALGQNSSTQLGIVAQQSR